MFSTRSVCHVLLSAVRFNCYHYKPFLLRRTISHAAHTGNELFVNKTLRYLRASEQYKSSTFQDANFTESREGPVKKLLENATEFRDNNSAHHNERTFRDPVRNLSKAQMVELFTRLGVDVTSKRTPLSDDFIRVLDMECARRVSMWGPSTCLLMMDLWLNVNGVQATKGIFFKTVLSEWSKFDVVHCHYVVQLLYYIGLKKSAPEYLMKAIQKWLEDNDMSALTPREVSIICEGFFKSKTKISSPILLGEIVKIATHSLEMAAVYETREILVYMLKALRHAKHRDYAFCQVVAEFLLRNVKNDSTSLAEVAHYAAFFANIGFYDPNLFKHMESLVCSLSSREQILLNSQISQSKRTNHRLKKTHPSMMSRPKDVARILWAFSEVGHIVNPGFKPNLWQVLVKHVRLHLTLGYFSVDSIHHLVDSVHSLVIVDIFDDILLKAVFSWMHELRNCQRQKSLLQLDVICASVQLEHLHHRVQPPIPVIITRNGFHVQFLSEKKEYQALFMVWDAVCQMTNGRQDYAECNYVLPYITIPGIRIRIDSLGNLFPLKQQLHGQLISKEIGLNDHLMKYLFPKEVNMTRIEKNGLEQKTCNVKDLYLEVISPSVCLWNTKTLTGIMRLKLRHLAKLGAEVILISQQHIDYLRSMTLDLRANWLLQFVLKSIGKK